MNIIADHIIATTREKRKSKSPSRFYYPPTFYPPTPPNEESMARQILRSAAPIVPASTVSQFEIRVPKDHLVFTGPSDESSAVVMHGKLVLCLHEPLHAHKLRMRFIGERRAALTVEEVTGTKIAKEHDRFVQIDILNNLDITTAVKQGAVNREGVENRPTKGFASNVLPPGNYEWKFQISLPGDLPESVEGMMESWIVYRLKATLDRGRFGKNLEARKHIRLIRTMSLTSDLAAPSILENEWEDRLAYSVGTPCKGITLGSNFEVNVDIIPKKKGLSNFTIDYHIREQQTIEVHDKSFGTHRRTFEWNIRPARWEMPEDYEMVDVDGSDGYRVQRFLQLPDSLRSCLQTFKDRSYNDKRMKIDISHELEVKIRFRLPGKTQTSEVKTTIPVFIYINGDSRVDDQSLKLKNPTPTTADLLTNEENIRPPDYESSRFDCLYREVDEAAYLTPAHMLSRSQSSENIPGTLDDATMSQHPNPAALRGRLTGLTPLHPPTPSTESPQQSPEQSRPTTSSGAARPVEPLSESDGRVLVREADAPHRAQGSSSGSGSGGVAGRTSPVRRSQHTEGRAAGFDGEQLSKVPSYGTATRQPIARTPARSGLPTYDEVATEAAGPVVAAAEASEELEEGQSAARQS